MQRVRIGLTGLAFVFVLVLLAAIFTSPSEEEALTPDLIEQRRAGMPATSVAADPAPKEPLAELGVAPGSVEANNMVDNSLANSAEPAPPPPVR